MIVDVEMGNSVPQSDCCTIIQYLLYNGHIVFNYTAHFVYYSPLNSYVYIHWTLNTYYYSSGQVDSVHKTRQRLASESLKDNMASI